MALRDRIYPLCELLLGAAYADKDFHAQEKTEIRSLLLDLSGKLRVEVEVCISSFDPNTFDPAAVIGPFKNDSEAERRKLLQLVSSVIRADKRVAIAENNYLRHLCALLDLPESALDGLVVELQLEEVKNTFHAVRNGPAR